MGMFWAEPELLRAACACAAVRGSDGTGDIKLSTLSITGGMTGVKLNFS